VASAILLTLQCGLRSSETRGLHWYDYDDGEGKAEDPNQPYLTPAEILAELQDTNAEDDKEEFVGATIFVHQAVIRTDKERQAKSLMLSDSAKTIHGERKLPVPLASQQALRWHRTRELRFHRSEEDKAARRWTISKDNTEGSVPEITDLIWPSLGRSGDPDHKHRTRPLDSSRLNRVLDVLRAAAGIARYACPNGHGNGEGSCPTCERPMLPGDAKALRPSEDATRPARGKKCITCGLVSPPGCRKCNRQLTTLRVHDLRHSYCTVLLAERKVSPADICVRMGWSPTPASMSAMLARYAHSTVGGKAAADEAVETMTGNIDELLAQRTARLSPRQENGAEAPNQKG
jgi:integrase